MREMLLEIFASIKRNKLRTFLTGFSVAWGIFMLIILLGAGNGLKNGMMSNFGDMARNSMSVRGGWTSKAYKGFQKERRVRLTAGDMDLLKTEFPDNIKDITIRVRKWNSTMSFGSEFCSSSLQGVTSTYQDIEGIELLQGRYINQTDVLERRKVVVLDNMSAKTLFKEADPVGQMIQIDKLGFTVVGVYKAKGFMGNSNVYVPASTVILTFRGSKPEIDETIFTVGGINTDQEIATFESLLRKVLGSSRTFDPNDESALRISNRMEEFKKAMMIFGGISGFVWIIGIGTLMAGIVGVSNIMLVTVRERTAEFGIRKALGAKPGSIVRLVLVESILITAFFGYIGMILGIGIMEVINIVLEQGAAAAAEAGKDKMVMFKNPTIDLSIVFSATIVLVTAGMIAGYVPARRAAKLKTIDAMRFNK